MKEDANAFEEYFTKYYRQVVGYLQKKVNSPHDAEDLAMDAFSACHEHFSEYDKSKSPFGTWLYIIVKNKLKNYYRDRKVIDEISDELPGIDSFEDKVIQAQYIDSLRNEFAKAILCLNETQRRIVVLKYFKEKNSSEIATIIGMTAVNVRVQNLRAIAIMKQYFQKQNIEWEL